MSHHESKEIQAKAKEDRSPEPTEARFGSSPAGRYFRKRS